MRRPRADLGSPFSGKQATYVRAVSVVLSHVGAHTLNANEVGGSLPPSEVRRPHPAGALARRSTPWFGHMCVEEEVERNFVHDDHTLGQENPTFG